PVTSRPSNQIEPLVGLSSPAIRRISDVLPDKVGPSSTLSEPFSRRIETVSMWVSAPDSLVTFFSSSIFPPPRPNDVPAVRLLGGQMGLRARSALHEFVQCLPAGRFEPEAELGPAPQHVLRLHR